MELYSPPDAGGSWEHRSGDCKTHGENVAFAKPYRSAEPHKCVACLLAVAKWLAEGGELP